MGTPKQKQTEIKECNLCGSQEVYLTSNKLIYGKEYGNGLIYLCFNCWSYVGTHDNSKKPLGILSTKEMKKKKIECHKLFDPIWKSKEVRRKDLYARLSDRLGIPKERCHFGEFDTEMLDKALNILNQKGWYK